MLCKVCGSQIPDDAKTCMFCGAPTNGENPSGGAIEEKTNLNENEQAAPPEADVIFDENEKKRRKQVKKMLDDKQKQLSEIEKRRNEKKIKKKRQKIALISLISAAGLGVVGVGAYYVMQNVYPITNVFGEPTPAPTVYTAAVVPTFVPPEAPADTPVPAEASPSAQATGTAASGSSANQSWTAASGSGSSSTRTASSVQSGTSSSGGSSSGGTSSSGGSSSGGTSSSGGASSSGASSSGGSSSGGASSSGSASSGGTSSGGASSGSASSGGAAQSGSSAQSTVAAAKDSGIVSGTLSSQLATGGEVIYNSQTGKYLMTFIADGVRYYANVSAGSTTEQIRNKAYTINAVPTQAVYNGNTIYEISDLTNRSDDFIFEKSSTVVLTEGDLKGLSKSDLALARNEIYARHGRRFQTPEFNAYFSSKSWYKINPDYNYNDDNSNLNEVEAKNVMFILSHE